MTLNVGYCSTEMSTTLFTCPPPRGSLHHNHPPNSFHTLHNLPLEITSTSPLDSFQNHGYTSTTSNQWRETPGLTPSFPLRPSCGSQMAVIHMISPWQGHVENIGVPCASNATSHDHPHRSSQRRHLPNQMPVILLVHGDQIGGPLSISFCRSKTAPHTYYYIP